MYYDISIGGALPGEYMNFPWTGFHHRRVMVWATRKNQNVDIKRMQGDC